MISAKEINKELKKTGKILQWVNPFLTERRFRLLHWLTRVFQPSLKDPWIHTKKVKLTRRDGSELTMMVHRPINKQPKVGVLWFFGGGYAIGSPSMENNTVKQLIHTKPCVVVVPDYRTSFLAPYPAALYDAYATLCWMIEHADELGFDHERLIVGGKSAGGGLAIALCLYARDHGIHNIAFQMPLYPMLDDQSKYASNQNNHAPLWDSNANSLAWKLYLKEAYKTDAVSKYAAPDRETNYEQLPPCVTFVGDIEPFYDETMMYIHHLNRANIAVTYRVYPGCYHGFDAAQPNALISQEATTFFLGEFARAVETIQAKSSLK